MPARDRASPSAHPLRAGSWDSRDEKSEGTATSNTDKPKNIRASKVGIKNAYSSKDTSSKNLIEEHFRQHLLHAIKLHRLLKEAIPVVVNASVTGADELFVITATHQRLPCGMTAPSLLGSDLILEHHSILTNNPLSTIF